jgi:hypothetical protein
MVVSAYFFNKRCYSTTKLKIEDQVLQSCSILNANIMPAAGSDTYSKIFSYQTGRTGGVFESQI